MPLIQARAEHRSNLIKKNSIFYDFTVAVEEGTHYSGVA